MPDGKEVGYEWDKVGDRRKVIYPEGEEVEYIYDKSQKLKTIKTETNEYNYEYDEIGRLIERKFPNNIIGKYSHNNIGMIENILYYKDGEKIEDHRFNYDKLGNLKNIERERKGLGKENKSYNYDPLNRLTKVIDGDNLIRKYTYDSLGNRIEKLENGERTKYHYNNLNQLIKEELPKEIKTYEYDKRGNRIKEFTNNELIKTFNFNPQGMMDKVINKDKGTAIYTYNGLDKRVGQTLKRQNSPEEKVSYTLDLLKPFKNILERDVNGEKEEYIYDRNILGTIEGEAYLIGRKASIIRSIEKTHEEIYSYDEFGIEDRNVLRSNPFGYTGYQYDDISELNFAEARYYDQNQGRFISEDNIKGFIAYPDSLNPYVYVYNKPEDYVDEDGNIAIAAPLAGALIGATVGVGFQVISDIGHRVKTGKWDTSLGKYVGSAAGGFIGGGLAFAAPSMAGWKVGAISGGVSGAVEVGIDNLTGRRDDSFFDIVSDTLVEAGKGAIIGKLSDKLDWDPMKRFKKNKTVIGKMATKLDGKFASYKGMPKRWDQGRGRVENLKWKSIINGIGYETYSSILDNPIEKFVDLGGKIMKSTAEVIKTEKLQELQISASPE